MSSKPKKPNTNTNLGTRITAPQNPVFRFKRPRNNNGTNGRRVSNNYENTRVKYLTNTPRSVTRNNNQTKTPLPNVTKKKSTKPRTNTPPSNVTKKKSTKPLTKKIPQSTKKNVIKMFNNKSQCISNNKTKNVCRALKYISKSQLLTGTSIYNQEIPFNKLNEKTSSIIKTIENASIKFNKKEIDLIASDKDFNIDFLFLVYLDTVHDKTYTGSFNQFLKSNIAKFLCKKGVPKFKVTTMIGNIIEESEGKITNNKNIIEAKEGFEKILKLKLNKIFDPKWVKGYGSSTSIKTKEKRLNVILDSEKGQGGTASGTFSHVSALIGSSKNGEIRSLKPLITLGSLFDPGKNMVQWGITRDIPNLFGKNSKTSLKWCLYTMNFNINNNTHISVGHNGKKYVLKINGKDITIGLSTSHAQKNKTNASKVLSKFMGDFLQNLYGIGIMYHYRKDKNMPPICLGTTDGNNTLMYAFMVHRILGQKPKIILDLSKNNEILLYNLKDHFTILGTPTYQSGPQVRRVGNTTVQQQPQQQKTNRANKIKVKRRLNTILEENSAQKKLTKTTTTKTLYKNKKYY